jgi:hypothetical protein
VEAGTTVSRHAIANKQIELTLVGVIDDAGVVLGIGSRETNEISGNGRAGTDDLELMATGVELGSGVLVGGVEGNDLVADEVVAGLEAAGDGVVDALVVGLHERGLKYCQFLNLHFLET